MTRFRLRELVGRGGMGEVYAARDDEGDHVVVKRLLKTLQDDPVLVQQLVDEGRLLGRVLHHNVVQIVDHGAGDEGPYLVMKRANGTTLNDLIDRDGPLTVRRAFAIATQLLAGLGAIHGAGIVHGDMKCSNVLVDGNDRVTIIDFGLARLISGTHRDQLLSGTPAYMAPELIDGAQPSIASDLYAVGVIIYELLTGETPFSGTADVLYAHQYEPVTPPSVRAPALGISRTIDRFALRALAKAPRDRFSTTGQMARALDELAAAEWEVTTVQIALAPPKPSRDDRGSTIVDALERAEALLAAERTACAISMLEQVVAAIQPGVDPKRQPGDPESWRLEMVLAALYDGVGKRQGARRLAMVAYRHAQQTGCRVALARTRALLDRLTVAREPSEARSTRLARGSGLFRRG